MTTETSQWLPKATNPEVTANLLSCTCISRFIHNATSQRSYSILAYQ